MAAFGGRPGPHPPKPVAPSARPGAAGPDDPGWVQRSPSITVDHRPKLVLEGFLVEAWIGALECEGPNPGSCNENRTVTPKLSIQDPGGVRE